MILNFLLRLCIETRRSHPSGKLRQSFRSRSSRSANGTPPVYILIKAHGIVLRTSILSTFTMERSMSLRSVVGHGAGNALSFYRWAYFAGVRLIRGSLLLEASARNIVSELLPISLRLKLQPQVSSSATSTIRHSDTGIIKGVFGYQWTRLKVPEAVMVTTTGGCHRNYSEAGLKNHD